MHFLETYLASILYVTLPLGIVTSPGSTVLFTGKLMMLLLLYIREDAVVVRQPIYGLLFGNVLLFALAFLMRHHIPVSFAPGRGADFGFLNEMGALMVWGTAILFFDCIIIILLYERTRAWFGDQLFARLAISGALGLELLFRGALQPRLGLPLTVIPNGIDAARLARTRPRDEARAALGFGPDDFIVGYVGRLAPEKRVHLILEAVAALPSAFKVLMVGWGPLLPELLEQANRLVPGRFAFATAHDHLGDYYGALDACCLLGTEEGFSLAMLEAMHCRCPVVATPVGAVPELVVDRVNGLVVSPTPDAVRESVVRLKRFPRWAAGLAAEAHAWADRHGHAARMARDYEDLLARLWWERPKRTTGAATVNGNGHAANGNGKPRTSPKPRRSRSAVPARR